MLTFRWRSCAKPCRPRCEPVEIVSTRCGRNLPDRSPPTRSDRWQSRIADGRVSLGIRARRMQRSTRKASPRPFRGPAGSHCGNQATREIFPATSSASTTPASLSPRLAKISPKCAQLLSLSRVRTALPPVRDTTQFVSQRFHQDKGKRREKEQRE